MAEGDSRHLVMFSGYPDFPDFSESYLDFNENFSDFDYFWVVMTILTDLPVGWHCIVFNPILSCYILFKMLFRYGSRLTLGVKVT